jgi:hypothetical protein
MLQSTPMSCKEDNADARVCQQNDALLAWTRTGTVDTRPLFVAVARAYNDVYYPDPAVTTAAILGPRRTVHVAQARHLCAYLLVEDYHLTNIATAQVLGRADHTTIVNSRARIAVALPRDNLLTRVLNRVRTDLSGHRYDERVRARRDEDRRRALAAASPQEWYEYRYWRLRALHHSQGVR